MPKRLEGKAVLITGAASGIGEASARLFAREGAALVLADRDPRGQQVADALDAAFVACDVSQARDVDALAGFTIRHFDRLDVVFANAGIPLNRPLAETTEEEWETVIGTDLKGVWLTCRAFVEEMAREGGGSIIATASQLGLVGREGSAVYGAAKAGVVNLVRGLAAEYGRRGVRVNALCPGPTLTEGTRRWAGDTADPEEALREVAAGTLLGRFGQPEEIAQAALFLASDESSYITGSALVVDGGYTST